MKFEDIDRRKAQFSGEYADALDDRPERSKDEPVLRARSVRVALTMRYHFTLGGWTLDRPPAWDPTTEVGAIWFAYFSEDSTLEIEAAKKIRLSHFGDSPPVNAERDALSILFTKRLKKPTMLICMSTLLSSFYLPDLFGGGALEYYIAANLRIYTDKSLVVDRTFISRGGDERRIASYQVIRV